MIFLMNNYGNNLLPGNNSDNYLLGGVTYGLMAGLLIMTYESYGFYDSFDTLRDMAILFGSTAVGGLVGLTLKAIQER